MKLKYIGFLITGLLFLAACASALSETEPVTDEAPATEAASTAAPEANECLACHTDKQRLIDTAKPEEIAESESKGVG